MVEIGYDNTELACLGHTLKVKFIRKTGRSQILDQLGGGYHQDSALRENIVEGKRLKGIDTGECVLKARFLFCDTLFS
jgi:hypothetical protein